MNLETQKNNKNNEILVRLTDFDMRNRLEAAIFDLVVTKAADKYLQEHGEEILHNIIDVKAIKSKIEEVIRERLIHESDKISK